MYINIQKDDNKYTEKQLDIILIQENERKRIARDLHDVTLQNLTHVIHQIELGEMNMERDMEKAHLEFLSARQNLKNVIIDIRNLIFDLRPMSFDDLGLKETFENFLDIIKNYSSFEIVSDIEEINSDDDYFLISLYRITREALMNSVKHSGGTKICFLCKSINDSVSIIVEDNGCGFTEQDLEKKNHYGMSVMKERVKLLKGTMNIEFTGGTRITFNIPLLNKVNLENI